MEMESYTICLFVADLFHLASLAAQTVKNLPGMQETRVQSLDQADPLEKGMTTSSSILFFFFLILFYF